MTDIACIDTHRQKYQIETDSPILEKIYIMQPITQNNEKKRLRSDRRSKIFN